MTTPTTTRRAAVYLRVSSERLTTDNQTAEVRDLAIARGYEPVLYEEVESAAKARPVFDRMLSDVRAGRVHAVAVWALDRLHRSMTGAINTVLELDRLGVPVLSVREGWLDTGGPVRPLLVAIFGWVAEQERTRLIERTKAGLERARREGKRLGRPPGVTGSAARCAGSRRRRGACRGSGAPQGPETNDATQVPLGRAHGDRVIRYRGARYMSPAAKLSTKRTAALLECFDRALDAEHLAFSPLRGQTTGALFRRMRGETDTGLVLMLTLWVEQALTDLLRAFFVRDAPAIRFVKGLSGKLDLKIALVQALGIFPVDVREDADLLKNIRNRFAHRVLTGTFRDSDVAELVDSLAYARTHPRMSRRRVFIHSAARVVHRARIAVRLVRAVHREEISLRELRVLFSGRRSQKLEQVGGRKRFIAPPS
jgi:putative DNA-invertase from lambdoid prophage Rac